MPQETPESIWLLTRLTRGCMAAGFTNEIYKYSLEKLLGDDGCALIGRHKRLEVIVHCCFRNFVPFFLKLEYSSKDYTSRTSKT